MYYQYYYHSKSYKYKPFLSSLSLTIGLSVHVFLTPPPPPLTLPKGFILMVFKNLRYHFYLFPLFSTTQPWTMYIVFTHRNKFFMENLKFYNDSWYIISICCSTDLREFWYIIIEIYIDTLMQWSTKISTLSCPIICVKWKKKKIDFECRIKIWY